ncbi:MAG: hypothetical protein MJY68_10525 [Bacteroidaceae bacterium]|nr:hypothetical protein [Bacteroidaceae bacterium]
MMKHIFSYIAILAAAAGFVSCSKEEANNPDNPDDFVSVIHACTDEVASKTALGDGYSVVWSEGDQIVLSDLTNNFTFKLTEGAGKTSGTFEHVGSVFSGTYTAYYPDTYDGVTWPETQTYIKKNGARENLISNAPMIAEYVTVSDKGTISDVTFENVGGILQISLTGRETIKSISFESKGVSGVTLDCGEGVALDKTIPTKFNIALKGGVYESAVITFVTTLGAKVEKKASSFTVKTGKIYPTDFGTLNFPAVLKATSLRSFVSSSTTAILWGETEYTGPETDFPDISYGVSYTSNMDYTTAKDVYEHGHKITSKGLSYSPWGTSYHLSSLIYGGKYRWVAFAYKGSDTSNISFGEVLDFETTKVEAKFGTLICTHGKFDAKLESDIKFEPEVPASFKDYKGYIYIAEGKGKTKEELQATEPIPASFSKGEEGCWLTGNVDNLKYGTDYSWMMTIVMPDRTTIDSYVTKFKTMDLSISMETKIITESPSTVMTVKAEIKSDGLDEATKKILCRDDHRPQFQFALTGKSCSDAQDLINKSGIKKSEYVSGDNNLSATYEFKDLDYGLMNHFAASVTIDGHTYYSDIKDIQLALPNGCVDLGSGSSVYWRDRNLGATETANGTDGTRARGDFFMWGETDWRHTGDWSSDYFKDDHYFGWGTGHYKWQKEVDKNYVTKYILKAHDGDSPVDGKAYLDLEDDAARHQLGYPWRMPRESECLQLGNENNFGIERHGDEDYNKQYYTIKSKSNGNSIAFQTSGQYHLGKELDGKGAAQMWTADLSREVDGNYQAICVMVKTEARGPFLVEDVVTTDSRDRVDGYGIRPVCAKITSANY